MSYSPNPLNAYDTYTYNIAMYMVNPRNLSQLDGAISSGVMMANNAIDARYNISMVEQLFVVGHGQVREAFANKFDIKLQEPNGVTFLSKIQQVSAQLGIENHTEATYILAIEFNGRMSDGSPRKHPQQFYYPIKFTKMDFNVTEGGTTYNIQAVENSGIAYNYLTAVIRDQITVVARTVGDFFDEFAEKLRESQENAWTANNNAGMYIDEYKFVFDEAIQSWREWKFEALLSPFEAHGANFMAEPGADPPLQVTINNGSNFSAIVGQILQLTKEYKQILAHNGGTFRQDSNLDADRDLSSFPTFHKIIANVEYGNFDILRNEYQKIITYKISPYIVPDELIDSRAYERSITNPSVQAQRVQNLRGIGLLRKRYDYYYTGKNTEVLDFDIQFNYLYYYALPYGDGYFGDPNTQTPQFSGDVPEIISRRERVGQARQNLTSATRSAREITGLGSSIGFSVVNSFQNAAQQARSAFDLAISDYESARADQFNFNRGKINHPIRFIQDVVDDGDIATSDNDQRSGVLKFGGVKMNLESVGDLITIELGIRGDPYWMGAPNSLYGRPPSGDVANYEVGVNSFYLNVGFPQADENAAGQRPPSPDYQISGVYMVTTVINRFENGQFIQYLTGHVDPATNMNTARDSLEGESSPTGGVQNAIFGPDGSILPAQQQENATRGITNRPSAQPINQGGRPPPNIPDGSEGPF